jgi:hypothetical protein
MLVIPQCLSNIYKQKLISQNTTVYYYLLIASGLHVSTLSSRHQAL